MPEPMSFETHLADLFTRYAELAPLAVDRSIAEQAMASGSRRRFSWTLAPLFSRPAYLWVALLLLLIVAFFAALAASRLLPRPDQLPGRFTETGPSQIRFIEAATLLADGRVLVMGEAKDATPNTATRSPLVEFFDPATDTFVAGPSMPEPRTLFSLTTLLDGRVLIAGGGSASQADGNWTSTNSTQLFDPRSGQFQSTGSLLSARDWHSAILLKDGRVLVVGGRQVTDGVGERIETAEIFDPAPGSWSAAGRLPVARTFSSTLRLDDGRVLFAGGWTDEGVTLDSVWTFDPSTSSFTTAGRLTEQRSSAAISPLPDGRVLIIGGRHENDDLRTAEIYDPATGKSTATASLLTRRSGALAFPLDDGRVLVADGRNLIGGPLSAEIFDPQTEVFTLAASARQSHGGPGVVLRDGRFLLAGFGSEIFDPSASTDVVEPVARTDRVFLPAASPVTDRIDHAAVKLADGRVLIAGGIENGTFGSGYSALNSAEIFDPSAASFSPTGDMSGAPQQGTRGGTVGTALLPDGRALFVRRQYHFGRAPVWELRAYDPQVGRFAQVGLPIKADNGGIDGPWLVRLSSGELLVVGPDLTSSRAPAQIYRLTLPDPTLSTIGTLPECPIAVQAVPGANDRLVVLCRAADSAGSIVTFDPATGSSVVPSVLIGHDDSALLALADGRVLIAAGDKLWLLDPTSGVATSAGDSISTPPDPMRPMTAANSLTLLADGRVLLISGTEAAVWDPATNATKSIPGPLSARLGHTATLLDDGHVLVVGGTVWPADAGLPKPVAAEIFDPAAVP